MNKTLAQKMSDIAQEVGKTADERAKWWAKSYYPEILDKIEAQARKGERSLNVRDQFVWRVPKGGWRELGTMLLKDGFTVHFKNGFDKYQYQDEKYLRLVVMW